MSPTYPLDPKTEMSEGEYMGYLQLDDLCAQVEHETYEPDGDMRNFMPRGSFQRAMRAVGYRVVQGPNDPRVAIQCPSDELLSFYEHTYGRDLLLASFSLLERLRGEIWRTREGREMTVEQMTESHAWNLQRWLERRADLVLFAANVEMGCMVVDHDGGEMAHDALDHEEDALLEMDALDYLRELKLYQLLIERIEREETS